MKQQSPIHKKNKKTALNNKPYFMALLSGTAYKEPEFAKKVFTKHGFTKSKFIDIDGAQCYIIWDNEDTIIAFRGTEPKEMSDVKADLNALKKKGFLDKGDVHAGFQGEINKIWDTLVKTISTSKTNNFYITGHSLGGAMATICAKRLQEQFNNVKCLYTYGSPRVGDKKWVKTMQVPHYRYQNNNDVVCRVPFWIMGYRHHGTNVYLNYKGNTVKLRWWRRCIDSMRGRLRAWSKLQFFDGVYDHDITTYAKRLKGVS